MTQENKHLSYQDRDELYDWIMDHHLIGSETNKKQKQSIRNYFDTGDINKYLADDQYVEPDIVIFYAPQHDVEHLKFRLKAYWDWVLADKSRISELTVRGKIELDQTFDIAFRALFGTYGALVPPKFYAQVFKLCFGEVYEPNRVFPIAFGDNDWQPLINIHSPLAYTQVMSNVYTHLFGFYDFEGAYRAEGVFYLCDYLISLIPYIPLEYFETTLSDRKHSIRGKRSGRRAGQFRVRKFFGQLYGTPTKGHIERGYDHVPNNNQEAYDKLKSAIDAMDMPDEFHIMMALFEEYGSDAYSISV